MANKLNTDKIIDYMNSHDFTRHEFCKRCGISVSTLNNILHNKNCIVTSLFKIAKAMDLQLYQLFE